jgi:hypothetical protein
MTKRSKHDFGPFCIDFHAVMKWSKMHQNMCLGSNGVDRVCLLRKKFQCGFVARACALIAQVRLVLHRFRVVTKWNETHQNMSLGSNGVDWVRLLLKIST